MLKAFFSEFSNILVIRPGALGDFILTLPVLAYLRRKYPQAHIEIMGYPSIAEIAAGRYYADKVFRFDHPEVAYLFLKDALLSEGLSRHLSGFDMIVSFLSNDVLIENLKRASSGYVLSHDPLPKANEATHIIDHLLSALGPPQAEEDVTPEERTPRIFLTEEDRQWASDFLNKHRINRSTPTVALHPGSGSRKKCWPVESFVHLALHLRKELEAQLLLVSGPADEEATRYFLNHVPVQAPALYNLPPPKLASLLETCALFLGNDSGITHLAAATGTATVALFGPTDPAVWGPRGKGVKIIQGNPPQADCSPCSPEERGRCVRSTCMEAIPPGQVIEAAEKGLMTTPSLAK